MPAASVPRSRDRRRALLGRRIPRQPIDLPAVRNHDHRECAIGANQSDSASRYPNLEPADRKPVTRITSNSPLMGELRAIEFVARLIDQGRLQRGIGPGKYRRINMHRVVLEGSAQELDYESRLKTDYDFFVMLRDEGRRAARRFLDAHFDDIGIRGTVDLANEVKAEWA